MPELNPPQHHPEVEPESAATLAQHLQTDVFRTHIDRILPKHLDTERFVSVCLRQLSAIPELQNCTLQSVIGGMMEAGTLGLEIGTQGECWLIPYRNNHPKDGGKPRKEAQLQVGVWGHMALAWRSEKIADVQIDVVLEGDHFQWQKGTDGFLHHIPEQGRDTDDVSAILGAYAVIRTVNQGRIFDYKDAAWIERIRSKSKSPNSPAWSNFYAEQSMAKVLKRTLKVCPKSRELARAITLDDEADAGVGQTFDVDTSFLLPSHVALDPKREEAQKVVDEASKKSRESQGFSKYVGSAPSDDYQEAMGAAKAAEEGTAKPQLQEEPPPADEPGGRDDRGGVGW